MLGKFAALCCIFDDGAHLLLDPCASGVADQPMLFCEKLIVVLVYLVVFTVMLYQMTLSISIREQVARREH